MPDRKYVHTIKLKLTMSSDIFGKGLHVTDIAAPTQVDPGKLARVLRVLATKHIFREISPDVFANNRLSSVLDTHKKVSDILAK